MPSSPRDEAKVLPLEAIALVALVTVTLLSPAHNDTWWHLRTGQEMLTRHAWISVDEYSHTVAGAFFWNPQWLGQLLMIAAVKAGGMPALSALCGAVLTAGWVVAWQTGRGDRVDRLLVFAIAVSQSTAIWSLRPQVFSVLMLPVVLSLVIRDKWPLTIVCIVLWANLHPGVSMVGLVIASVLATTAVYERDRLLQRGTWCLGAGLATLVTPLGVTNWLEVLASTGRSQANRIHEWSRPGLPPDHLLFWAFGGWVTWLVVRRWRSASHADRIVALISLLLFAAAARSLRVIPFFMMTAAIAASRLLRAASTETVPTRQLLTAPAAWGAAVLGAVVVWHAWTTPWQRLGWEPMAPAAAKAIAACPPHLYNTYAGGGPIIWFVPGQRVFVDSRQDPYPIALIQEETSVETTGHFEQTFSRHGIRCAALPPDSPTIAALRRSGWRETYRDGQWVVLQP